MKPGERRPEEVFRVIDRKTGELQSAYSRAYFDEYDFASVARARMARCDGEFANKQKYKIAKYRVTYELIADDVDA